MGRKDLVLEDIKPQQGIYVFGCQDSVIQVRAPHRQGRPPAPRPRVWWPRDELGGARGERADGAHACKCVCDALQVKGKCNAISIDACAKTGVVFGDVIAAAEVVNSRGLQLQCTGFVPTISIEKTDGVQIYVTKKVTRLDAGALPAAPARCMCPAATTT